MKPKLSLQDPKALRIIVILGLTGILLLFFSSFFPKQEKKNVKTVDDSASSSATNEQYEKKYQKTVEDLVDHIAGAGNAKVYVTLESGMEYVYETEENQTADTQNDAKNSFSEKNSMERNTLLVEDADGSRRPLIRKTLEPKVRGVVVVCEGGGDVSVTEQITNAVTTALGISSTRVCVAKMSDSSV